MAGMVSAIVRNRCSLTRERLLGFFPLRDFPFELFRAAQGQDPRDDGDQGDDGGPGENGRQDPQQTVESIDGPAEDERLEEEQSAAGEEKRFEDPKGARDAGILPAAE